jgi:plasmid maintenance system antidote protein VapI
MVTTKWGGMFDKKLIDPHKTEIKTTDGVVLHPGKTLKENLVFYGISQVGFGYLCGLTPLEMINIIDGYTPLTRELAEMLEKRLGIYTANQWMEMETKYRKWRADNIKLLSETPKEEEEETSGEGQEEKK